MVAGNVISKLLGLASSVIVARILGKVPFGEFGTIQSTVGLFGVFAGLGIGITATKYVAEYRGLQTDRCGRVIGFALAVALAGGILASLGLLLFGGWLARNTLAAPELAPMLRTGVGLVIFGSLQGAYLGALAGFEAFKQVCWVNFLSSVLAVPLLVVGAMWDGLAGAVWALVLQTILGCVLGHIALLKEASRAGVKISLSLHPDELAMLWRFTLPAFLSTMLSTPAGWFSRTLLVNQPGGYGEAALLSAANQWMNLVNFLPWTMGSVLVPIFANLHATGKRHEFMKLLRRNLVLNAAVALAVALPLILFSSVIMGFYGPGFRTHWGIAIFILAMVCGVVAAIKDLFSRTMQSAGRAWIDLSSNGIWALVVVLASCVLIRPYKGFGNVAAHTIAATALVFWQWFVIRRMFKNNRPKNS